jgi:DNA-binding response OmpR family regulator
MHNRALIVDDEPATCQLIEKVLGSVGMDSLSVTKSVEAPDILQRGKFAMVFVDDQMPFPDGPELTRQMRDSSRNRITPIVMISDDKRPAAMARGFQAGASFFMYKPLDRERLLMIVRATQGAIEHEHRRTRRVPVKSRVLLKHGGQVIEAESVDVSMEGVLVKAQRVLPLGSSVDIQIQLNRAMGPIVGVGSVVRVAAANHMGIHLGRLSLPESQKLQDFLLPLIAGS